MEFNDLLTQDLHEEGAEVEIISPATGEKTGFFIKVMGMDSLEFQKAQKKLRNQAIKALQEKTSITEEDEIESEINQLVAITVGWKGIEVDGKDKPFTKEACKQLYTKSPGIRQQVDRFVGDRLNFTKG
ncbi:MAG: hypothetical protein ACN2B6_01390 [Rickettsiales bacterium]